MPQEVERLAVAKKLDLSNIIHIADKKKTVFLTQVAKGPATMNTNPQWPADNFPAPKTTGAVDEQDVHDFENLGTPNFVLNGRVQIFERKPRVSRLLQLSTDQAGVGPRRAFAKSVAKGLIMIARDIETTLLGDNDSVLGTAAVGNQTRGLGKWISNTAQTDFPVPTALLTPATSIDAATTIANYTDATPTAILQSMFDQTGDADADLVGICGSTVKRAFSGLTYFDSNANAAFLPLRRYNADAEDKQVTIAVDILDTDFGKVALRLSSFINTGGDPTTAASKRLCYVLPMNEEMVRVRFADPPNMRELEDQGGGPRGLIQAIGCLEVGNPLGLGKFAAPS